MRIARSAWRVGFWHSAGAAFRFLRQVVLQHGVSSDGFVNIQPRAFILVEPEARLVIGRHVQLKNDAIVYVKRGATLTISDNVSLGHHAEVSVNQDVRIGADTFTAPYVYITDSNHRFDRIDVPIQSQPMDVRPTAIGRDVWIGRGAMVLAGAQVGDHCVLGAGAIVTRTHAPGDLVVGIPGRTVRNRFKGG